LPELIQDWRGPTDPIGKLLLYISRFLAIAGGILLCGLGLTTVITIILIQFLGIAFVGEFEVVSFGMVLTVYLFMPYCQMVGGNVIVDVFTIKAPPRLRAIFDALSSLVFAAFWILLMWRMAIGMSEMMTRQQTTAALKLEYWWTFPVALSCFSLLIPICIYTTWKKISERAS
jgi:TRAP-type C4-dicarboxylate transport system permease small subunit